jgi:Ferritin-like domain
MSGSSDFLLMLEELQDAFYAEARRRGALTGELSQFARIVGAHERRHVAYLRKTLGGRARPRRPQADFGTATSDPDEFVAAATALEDAVVSAFNGQGPNLTRSGLATAARILSVEARHAAWIRAVAEEIPAPVPNDPATTEKQAVRTLARTGFSTEGRGQ